MDMTEPLDDVVPNADVLDIVRASNSRHLLPAIAGIEDLEDAAVTLDNLQMIGMGLEELFKDIVLASEKSAWLTTYAAKIVEMDPVGMKLHFPNPDHDSDVEGSDPIDKLKIKRTLRSLLDKLLKADASSSSKPVATTVHIVKDDGDNDSGFTDTQWQTSELEAQQKKIRVLYGRVLSPDIIPKVSVLRRCVYSFMTEQKMPDSNRISIASLRVSPQDPPGLLLKRYLAGMLIASAGCSGDLPHYNPMDCGKVHGMYPSAQWLCWHDCLDLCDAFDTQTPGVDDAVAISVLKSVIDLMSKMTSFGRPRPTASAAVVAACTDVIRFLGGARAAATAAASATATTGPPPGPPNDSGEYGSNGLLKMRGGNPRGAPCKDFLRGECTREKCCFSHKARKKPKLAAGASSEQGDDE